MSGGHCRPWRRYRPSCWEASPALRGGHHAPRRRSHRGAEPRGSIRTQACFHAQSFSYCLPSEAFLLLAWVFLLHSPSSVFQGGWTEPREQHRERSHEIFPARPSPAEPSRRPLIRGGDHHGLHIACSETDRGSFHKDAFLAQFTLLVRTEAWVQIPVLPRADPVALGSRRSSARSLPCPTGDE